MMGNNNSDLIINLFPWLPSVELYFVIVLYLELQQYGKNRIAMYCILQRSYCNTYCIVLHNLQERKVLPWPCTFLHIATFGMISIDPHFCFSPKSNQALLFAEAF